MSRYRHRPIFQRVQNGYGWIYPVNFTFQSNRVFRICGEYINRRWNGLTKREELSLRTVLALPNASRTGLVWTTWSSREPFFWVGSSAFLVEAPTVAKYAITFFVFSVFPAPDSPVINMDWFSLSVNGRRGGGRYRSSVCSKKQTIRDISYW